MATGSRVERKKYEKQHSNSKAPKGKKSRRIFKKLLVAGMTFFFLLVLGGAALFGFYAMNSPKISSEDLTGQVSSKIYDINGSLIKELGGQNRDLMTAEEITPLIRDAVLAIEDARFYQHNGVDPIRIVGSALANLQAGEIVQGGSTITQQLVKLSVFSTDFQDQTLERKAQEAWLAMQIEQEYSKDEILTYYLNKMFYSNNTYGLKTAANNFFGKQLADLSLAEAALLAGLPQAPSNYDPYSNPEAARERRDLVLDVMLQRELISLVDYQEAIATPIEAMLVPINEIGNQRVDFVIDAYLDVVAQEVQDKLNLNIYTDGIEVYTNMDFQLQEHLYETVNNNSAIGFTDDKMQTAVSIINVDTGQISALIGGRKQNVTLGLNRANTLNRSVGSTMKPLSAYGPAIEYLNYSTGQRIVDEPYNYTNGAELYNYDFAYNGQLTIREALASSRNIPALKVLQAVGLDNAYAFLQKIGIQITNDGQKNLVEANAIGGEVTPIKLAAAYAAIANYGEYHQAYTVNRVITKAGTEETYTSEGQQVMKDSTAYMLVDILKDVPGNFAASAAIEGLNHAGKTGTTNYTAEQLQNLNLPEGTYAAPDGWYVGMTPQYAISAWVGYDNPNEVGNYLTLAETGIPQRIYKEMMTFAMRNVPKTDWTMPSSVVEVEIEKYTDPIYLPGPYTPSEFRAAELFIAGREPAEISYAYGRYIAPPSGFTAQYLADSQTIVAQWQALATSGQFELTIYRDGVLIDSYLGSGNTYSINASQLGNYTLRLRIIDGNSSSDTLVFNIDLSVDESSSEESDSIDDSQSSESSQPEESNGLNEADSLLPEENNVSSTAD